MKILSFSVRSSDPAVVCLGRFDGLHIGHRKLIEKARSFGGLSLALFTIRPAANERSIMTFDELSRTAESLGVEEVIYADAESSFFDTEPESFLKQLTDRFSVKAVVCGEDFTYGKGRKGNVASLERFCTDNGLLCFVCKTVENGGEKVSSSTIKELLSEGSVKRANALLFSEFNVTGTVIGGRGDGGRLGIKTANIVYPEGKTELSFGVYATQTIVKNRVYDSLSFYGVSPTFNTSSPTLETHLIDFSDNIYGDVITVKFVDFIRENKRFYDVRNLLEQIKKDLEYYD